MANCSYGPNGQLPSDAQFVSAVRSKRLVGCSGKVNEMEVNDLVVNRTINAPAIFDSSNVKFYGAVGDGVTDDTVAIQTALDSVDCITIPPGQYVITSTIVVPTERTIRGCGRGSIILTNADLTFQLTTATTLNNFSIVYNGANFATSVGIQTSSFNFINSVYFNTGVNLSPAIAVTAPSSFVFVVNSTLVGVLQAFTTTSSQISITNTLLSAGTTCILLTAGQTDFTFTGNTLVGDGTTTGIDFATCTECYSIANTFNSTISTLYANTSASTITTDNIGGINVGGVYSVAGTPVVGAQRPAIADASPVSPGYVQSEVQEIVNQLNALLAAVRLHGLIAT